FDCRQIEELHGTSRRVDAELLPVRPTIRVVVMIDPHQYINIRCWFSDDGAICLIDTRGVKVFVSGALNRLKVQAGRFRVRAKFLEKLCDSFLMRFRYVE